MILGCEAPRPCPSSVSVAVIKYLDKSYQGSIIYFGEELRNQSIIMGRPGGRSLKQLVLLHLLSGRENTGCCYRLNFLLFVDSRTPGKGDGFAFPN